MSRRNKWPIPSPPAADLSCLPERLLQRLMPFQKEGVNFAISKDGRCLIADEMGLGKTLQAIAVAYYYKTEWPLLIIVPASLKYQWVEELEKWLPELLPTDINMINNSSDVCNISKCGINIVAYSLLRYGNPETSILLKSIKAQRFKIIICDESHNIKNKKSRTSNIVVDLVLGSKRCILLSGTPALNKPAELYTQINAVLPNKFGTWNDYTVKYCDARYVYYGAGKVWNVEGAKNLDELEHKLKTHLMIRRLKKDVLSQLPPKRRQKIPFDLKFDSGTQQLQNELTAMQEELERLLSVHRTSVAQVVNPSGDSAPSLYDIRMLISQLYMKTCEAKVGPVVEFVLFYTSSEDAKVLIFAHHKKMMDSIQEALWNSNTKHIRIDGQVPTKERAVLVKQFQSDKTVKVALLSILAAGSGLTLTAASVVVFAELYWTPAILMQCEDRAHRIGQQANSVNIYYLVARGTIDERVWSMVEKKTRVLTMALDGMKGTMSAMTANKHVSEILSSAALHIPSELGEIIEDVDVEDFFRLEDLKRSRQLTLSTFITPEKTLISLPKKRQKKLVMQPIEVVDMANGGASDADVCSEEHNSPSSKRRCSFMKNSKTQIENRHSMSDDSNQSLPSLDGSPKIPCELGSGCESVSQELTDETFSKTVTFTRVRQRPGMQCENTNKDSLNTEKGCTSAAMADRTLTAEPRSSESRMLSCSAKVDPVMSLECLPAPSSEMEVADSQETGDLFSSDSTLDDDDLLECVRAEQLKESQEKIAVVNKIPVLEDGNGASSGHVTSDAELSCQSSLRLGKEEDLRIAQELLDESEDVELMRWTCSCGSVNSCEDDCCPHCALPQVPTTWVCRSCQHLNSVKESQCDECFAEREEAIKEEERIVDLSAIAIYKTFLYLVSPHTTRIFIHNEAKEFLKASFHSVDIDNPDLLPDILLRPENFELAKTFVDSWNNLKKREQRVLIKRGELIECPEKAYFGGRLTKLRKSNTQRYKTKKDVAACAEAVPGASTRQIFPAIMDKAAQKDNLSRGYLQAVSADNQPLCINCQSAYEAPNLSSSVLLDDQVAWETRFCSPECADGFWMRTNNGYIRDAAKTLDAGVCEMCQTDAQEIYRRIKQSRSLKDRAELLQGSRFAILASHVKVHMVKEPSEGQFWHVDHILPVYAGGGQTDIDNLRTLCSPCHQLVTAAQAGHRSKAKAAIGNHSITEFFSPGTNERLRKHDKRNVSASPLVANS